MGKIGPLPRKDHPPMMTCSQESWVSRGSLERTDVAQLASVFDVSTGTIFIHDDLGLVKKSARWVPKLLSQEQKDNRIACSRELKKVVMDDVEDGPSGDIKDRGQLSHINTSVLFNEPLDIIDHLLSPDKLVDSLAPVVLHVQDGVAQYI